MPKTTNFLVDKANIFKTSYSETEIPELKEGEILFKLDKYAFTTNNITYAVVGHRIGYWKFFPAEEPWGIVPVWGFAEVVESKHEGVKIGERCYGYFPMSSYLKVEVGGLNPFGFKDITAHRTELPPIYNYYNRVAADPSYNKETEDFIPIFKPLFATAFLNYYFLKDADFYGSEQIILTSASSKTALGIAHLLKQNQAEDGKKIIGLTSPRNVEFVEGTGFYDQVIAYQKIGDQLPQKNSVVVDLAGNGKLLEDIHDLLQQQLQYASLIGFTDWQAGKPFKHPVAEFFFAPTQAQKIQKEWGAEEMNIRLAKALHSFISHASNWIEIRDIKDQDTLTNLYMETLKGHVNPKEGCVVSL